MRALSGNVIVVKDSIRLFLLGQTKMFVEKVRTVQGVVRIAMIGSLLTDKKNPKDTDLLITISSDIDIDSLAKAGRQLKGRCQSQNAGADIFLCSLDGQYLGRTCSYNECHPRVACLGTQCHRQTRIRDDFSEVRLDSDLVSNPPLEIWPSVVKRGVIPPDVESMILE